MYLVVFDEENAAALDAVRGKWPKNHRILDERSAVVVPEDDMLTADVKEALRIGPDAQRAGIVFKITNYSGYWDTTLWEWLGKFE